MTLNEVGDRLDRVAKPLNMNFYHDRGHPTTFTAPWGCSVSFDVIEVARILDDWKLKQWIINRTIVRLREQIDHLESLR